MKINKDSVLHSLGGLSFRDMQTRLFKVSTMICFNLTT